VLSMPLGTLIHQQDRGDLSRHPDIPGDAPAKVALELPYTRIWAAPETCRLDTVRFENLGVASVQVEHITCTQRQASTEVPRATAVYQPDVASLFNPARLGSESFVHLVWLTHANLHAREVPLLTLCRAADRHLCQAQSTVVRLSQIDEWHQLRCLRPPYPSEERLDCLQEHASVKIHSLFPDSVPLVLQKKKDELLDALFGASQSKPRSGWEFSKPSTRVLERACGSHADTQAPRDIILVSVVSLLQCPPSAASHLIQLPEHGAIIACLRAGLHESLSRPPVMSIRHKLKRDQGSLAKTAPPGVASVFKGLTKLVPTVEQAWQNPSAGAGCCNHHASHPR
jgi:hypothetical protein